MIKVKPELKVVRLCYQEEILQENSYIADLLKFFGEDGFKSFCAQ
jgi:hypothetical protein